MYTPNVFCEKTINMALNLNKLSTFERDSFQCIDSHFVSYWSGLLYLIL